ncbi:MAG TPA: histidine kinase dimerization/phospho-acceptor domain-containing protein [Candidatus Sumerlaeota bacterium]|nr:histidine kinase dimerization/phospho-acceptor domain-containing protein [Candidatus Sumerlaeota bacterium]HPS00014.1 histidine kinase dimerization/phospho-acceptor domain-containing protein [Candidatus Sumerlaeota bacterium]
MPPLQEKPPQNPDDLLDTGKPVAPGGSPHAWTHEPGPWEARLMISLPAVLVLLVIGIGLANYFTLDGVLDSISDTRRSLELIYLENTQTGNQPQETTRLKTAIDNLKDTSSENQNHILITLILFSILAVLCGIGLVLSILSPLRKVTEAAASIARGDTQQKVHFKAGFELGELGKSFNSLVNFVNSMAEQRDAYLNQGETTGWMIVEADGRVTTMDPAGLRLLGTQARDVIGKTLSEIRASQPALAPAFLMFCENCAQALSQVEYKEGESQEQEILPLRPIEIEMGETEGLPRTLSVVSSLLRDEKNESHAVMIHFRDTAYLKNLSELFSRTDQLAALGTFTVGLSHELRNPLGVLKGLTQLLQEKIADRSDCSPYLTRIVREVDRLDSLIRELYDFSSSPLDQPETQDFNRLVQMAVQHTRQMLEGTIQEGKDVREEYAENLGPVTLQGQRVIRAINAVLTNAFEQMPVGATLTLRTSSLNAAPHSPVVLDIVNTGSTIDEKVLDRVFEPFFSTKQGGPGLGLAIAYQIVAQNHGQLTVQSQPDQVRFRFVFGKVPAASFRVENGA